MCCSLVGFFAAAIGLSAIGALAMRAAARALGLRARTVIGVGPSLSKSDPAARQVELRPVPLWISTALVDARGARAFVARALALLAMLVVPFATLVIAVMIIGFDTVDEGPPFVVGEVVPSGPAARAGLRSGDVIVRCVDRTHPSFSEIVALVRDRRDQPVSLVVERDGEPLELTMVPELIDGAPRLGIRSRVLHRRPGPLEAIARASAFAAQLWRGTASALFAADGAAISSVGMTATIAVESPTTMLLLLLGWCVAVAPIFALASALQQIVGGLRRSRASPAATPP